MNRHAIATVLGLTVLGLTVLAVPATAQVLRTASGSLADVTVARDAFRDDIGGGTTPGSAGSFGGVRREINWDGTPDSFSQPNAFPVDFFNSNSPRGVVFSNGAANHFGVSAKTGNPSATPVRFADLDPLYDDIFAAFTEQRLFASLDDPVYDIHFFVAGTNVPGLVTGFGAVVTDVDDEHVSFVEFFDVDGALLARHDFPAAAGDGTFSFVGLSFDEPTIARVRMGAGDVALGGGGEPGGADAVAIDDLIFGEPVEAVGAPCVPTPTALCFLDNRFRVEATFTTSNVGDGVAKVQPLSDNSGTMSFFNVSNREALVKVLDACSLNDAFWFFAAAATNVGYTFTVTDTVSGTHQDYSKAEGPPAPAINDTTAFETCDI